MAISKLYNVGVKVWELSQRGELLIKFDNTTLAASKGLNSIYLVRHRGVHYNIVTMKKRKLPLIRNEELSFQHSIRAVRVSLIESFWNSSVQKPAIPLTETLCAAKNNCQEPVVNDDIKTESEGSKEPKTNTLIVPVKQKKSVQTCNQGASVTAKQSNSMEPTQSTKVETKLGCSHKEGSDSRQNISRKLDGLTSAKDSSKGELLLADYSNTEPQRPALQALTKQIATEINERILPNYVADGPCRLSITRMCPGSKYTMDLEAGNSEDISDNSLAVMVTPQAAQAMEIDGNIKVNNSADAMVTELGKEVWAKGGTTMDWISQKEEDQSIEPGDDGEPSKEQIWSMPDSEEKLHTGTMLHPSEDFKMGATPKNSNREGCPAVRKNRSGTEKTIDDHKSSLNLPSSRSINHSATTRNCLQHGLIDGRGEIMTQV